MAIRTLLVDDEGPARARLRALLERIEDLEIVGEVGDGLEAVERIAEIRPDLVFLDIEMPGMNGMEVASVLSPPRPKVVFCTAYDQYAIQAFEQHATDYLLKPVRRSRLESTLGRVREALRERTELHDASRTQERLLPQSPPTMRTLDYTGLCRPARGIGGDLYDFLPIAPERLGLVMADVSGKGVFAGLLMASLQARVQLVAPRFETDLGRLARELNRLTHASIDANRYATLFYGRYDDRTRELTYVNAGHLPPIVVRRGENGDTLERLDAGGTVIGLFADAEYRACRTELRPGDGFCMFTDGLTETADPSGREFGLDRLGELLLRHGDLGAKELAERIVAEVDRFADGADRVDDLTLVIGRVR